MRAINSFSSAFVFFLYKKKILKTEENYKEFGGLWSLHNEKGKTKQPRKRKT